MQHLRGGFCCKNPTFLNFFKFFFWIFTDPKMLVTCSRKFLSIMICICGGNQTSLKTTLILFFVYLIVSMATCVKTLNFPPILPPTTTVNAVFWHPCERSRFKVQLPSFPASRNRRLAWLRLTSSVF